LLFALAFLVVRHFTPPQFPDTLGHTPHKFITRDIGRKIDFPIIDGHGMGLRHDDLTLALPTGLYAVDLPHPPRPFRVGHPHNLLMTPAEILGDVRYLLMQPVEGVG